LRSAGAAASARDHRNGLSREGIYTVRDDSPNTAGAVDRATGGVGGGLARRTRDGATTEWRAKGANAAGRRGRDEPMGAIEEVHEDLDADVDLDAFADRVAEKVEQMGGLADEETAAMLVAHELEESGGEVEGVADVAPGMDEARFVAKVVSVGEVNTFERDGDDPDGRVANVEVADETGRIRIAFWDEMAGAVADGELEVGDVVRVAGRPQEGYSGVEVNVDRAEIDEDAEVDIQVLDRYRVEDLSLGLSDVTLRGRVLDTDSVRTFDRDDGTEGRVANLTLGDPTGRVRVTLWDERADLATAFDPGESVEVVDGYVRERDGDLELHVGSRGAVETIDEEIRYVPETTDIAALEIGDRVDIAGGVIEASSVRTFDRDDGSQGQVRNVRLKDETGDVRVALWGEKADLDVDLGDYVVATDVEIDDGWQDDVEASANWRSTITVSDRPPAESDPETGTDAGGADGDAGGAGDAGASDADAGLGAFAADGDGDDRPSGEATAATGAVGVDADAEGDADGSDEVVEFTGTVVQAGEPVVLDDGRQTRSVETETEVRLGEEITVRGRLSDGRIDADEVF
jgi:replication factor A1